LDWIEEKVWTRNRWRSVSGHNTTHNATVGDHCIYLQAEVTPITERNIDLYVLYKWLCAQREREGEPDDIVSVTNCHPFLPLCLARSWMVGLINNGTTLTS